MRRVVRELVGGKAGTSEARSAATPSWGEHGDESGAQRRREEDTAVTGTTPSNRGRSVSARHRR